MTEEIYEELPYFIKFIIYMVFIVSFIIPTGYFNELGYPVSSIFFTISILITYSLLIKTVSIREFLFITGITILALSTKNIEVLHFVSIPTLYKILKYKDQIRIFLLNTKIVWISLLFTLFYILIYFSENGRWIHTSIKEINMSGLALLSIALIVRKRNVFISNIVLIIGIFTLSRNYLLALIILSLMNIQVIKEKIITNKVINKTTFIRMLFISSSILLLLAFYFESLYFEGELSSYALGFERFVNLKDMSNYFRFTANKYVISILMNNRQFMLKGIPYDDFFKYGAQIASSRGQAYRNTIPHNFFFSYLKIYGVFSIFIFSYISEILNKVISKRNYNIYLAFLIYAFFLGIGFNSYWLYLLVFNLILYQKDISE